VARPDPVTGLEDERDLVALVVDRDDARPVAQDRAVLAGEPPMRRVALRRIRDPGVRLVQAEVLLAQPPRRPSADDLRPVEALEREIGRASCRERV